MTDLKKLLPLLPVSLSLFFLAPPAMAAAPDGFGPWADKVISAHQGVMKNGQPVPLLRSNPLAALGVAENDTLDSHFYSLGFGGKITLGFKNGIKSGVFVVEATNPNYPLEKATIEVSPDKTHWFPAGTVVQDGQVNVPHRAGCVHYVRITDISDASIMPDDIADGYDVDGVKGIGKKCSIKEHDDNHKDHTCGVGKNEGNYWGPYTNKQEKEIDNGE
jgi:hypothetical protein